MLIFLEYSFVVKAIYLYALFNLVAASLNKFIMGYKVIALSILGGCILSALSFFELSSQTEILITALIVGVTSYVLFYPKTLSKTLEIILTAFAYLLLKWGFSYLLQKLLFYTLPVTVSSIIFYYIVDVILVSVFSVVIYVAFRVIYQKKLILDFVYNVVLETTHGKIKLKMLLDSGNSLTDEITSLPIIVCSKRALENQFNAMIDESKLRKVEYQTLSGFCSNMHVFEPYKIYIEKDGNCREIKALIGIVDKKFKLYDGLLHVQTC